MKKVFYIVIVFIMVLIGLFTISQMGDKASARQFMSETGVPIVSGSDVFLIMYMLV